MLTLLFSGWSWQTYYLFYKTRQFWSLGLTKNLVWCEFDHASPLICGNKMPTRCNRWLLYCRSYCLLNMFQAPLCPSSGAQEYYTGGCCLWYLVLWFSICRSAAASHKPDTQPTALHQTDDLKTKAPNTTGSNHLCNTLELLMMGIMVPETCWTSSKIGNKETICCI